MVPVIARDARIEALCTVDAGKQLNTFIGKRVWLMKGVHVGHDTYIGAGSELAPHCSVGGHVILSENVKVGQGATFKPFVVVGEGARIGMGAVVIRNVPPHEVWAGSPARRIDTPN
jgi:acetyltransferase-like isoleucine patch superfamily enzyme